MSLFNLIKIYTRKKYSADSISNFIYSNGIYLTHENGKFTKLKDSKICIPIAFLRLNMSYFAFI